MLKEELENVASLARIYIDNKEKEKYLKDINKMFDYIEILQEPGKLDLPPTTHVTSLRNVWREDDVNPCSKDTQEMIFKGAPETEGSFYKVKKVVETQ
jgi:aspartyl-tRNA(Asn)/glutamyl-tRNA(Gln) amidotransferase subunit C